MYQPISSCSSVLFYELILFFFFGIIGMKAEPKEKLTRMYEVKDPNAIFVFKFRTHFGGGSQLGLD